MSDFLANNIPYKNDFAFLNKSYAKDLNWSLVLYRSYERYVQGQFDFYIVVPESDVALFVSQFNILLESKKIHRTPIIFSEEYVLSVAQISSEDVANMSGWEVQQIIKLAFSYTCLAKNYVAIDSASIFSRKFCPTTIWLDRFGIPKTFALALSRKERTDQYLQSGEKGWLKGGLVSIATVYDAIDTIMDGNGLETNFYTGFGCFSSNVINRMMEFLSHKGFSNIAKLIRFAPYEFTWYGAFVFYQNSNEFSPIGYIFKPIVSSGDLQSINTLHLNQSQYYGFLFQPPIADSYSPIELEAIVQERSELFHASSSWLKSVVGKFSISTTAQEGFLVYGPYAHLDDGLYRISIFGQGNHWVGNEWLDVVCNYNQKQHELLRVNFAALAPGLWRAEHLITVEKSCTEFEIRLWVAAGTAISVEGIEIKKLIVN